MFFICWIASWNVLVLKKAVTNFLHGNNCLPWNFSLRVCILSICKEYSWDGSPRQTASWRKFRKLRMLHLHHGDPYLILCKTEYARLLLLSQLNTKNQIDYHIGVDISRIVVRLRLTYYVRIWGVGDEQVNALKLRASDDVRWKSIDDVPLDVDSQWKCRECVLTSGHSSQLWVGDLDSGLGVLWETELGRGSNHCLSSGR